MVAGNHFSGTGDKVALFHLVAAVFPAEAGGNIALVAVGIAADEGHFEGGALPHGSAAGIVPFAGGGGKGNRLRLV